MRKADPGGVATVITKCRSPQLSSRSGRLRTRPSARLLSGTVVCNPPAQQGRACLSSFHAYLLLCPTELAGFRVCAPKPHCPTCDAVCPRSSCWPLFSSVLGAETDPLESVCPAKSPPEIQQLRPCVWGFYGGVP